MPSTPLTVVSLLLGAVAAVALVSCGSDDRTGEIPPTNASVMLGVLDGVDPANCDEVGEAAAQLQAQVEGLPDDVGADLRNALMQGADNLATLANDESQCEETTTTETEPTTTETEPTTTTEETTTETDTTTQTTTQTKPQPPGGGSPGGGNPGRGNQGGGGGPPDTGGTGGNDG